MSESVSNMNSPAHYARAPITEAIIDLRVVLPESARLEDLSAIARGREDEYPHKQDRHFTLGQMQLGEQVSASASSRHIGYLFKSADGCNIFQARLDGFTMSRLAPYDRWERFRDEARRWWDEYYHVAKPTIATRIALRYINRLDLPLPLADFKDYLRTVPEVSPDLPQGLAGYFIQLRIPLVDINSMAVLSETIIEPVKPGVVSVVLDIDISRSDDLPSNHNALWEFFEELHVRKNEVFEACITDRTRELIK